MRRTGRQCVGRVCVGVCVYDEPSCVLGTGRIDRGMVEVEVYVVKDVTRERQWGRDRTSGLKCYWLV